MLTATPPSHCQSSDLQPAYLDFQTSHFASSSAPSPTHAAGSPFPVPVRTGLSVFANPPERLGKSVILGDPGVQATAVKGPRKIQPFVNLGSSQPQQLRSLGGQPQQLGSLGGQPTGGHLESSLGQPQQLGPLGGQLTGGRQHFLNLGSAGPPQLIQPQLDAGTSGLGPLQVGGPPPPDAGLLQGHPPSQPLMMPDLRPPMTPTQMLKFSVKPQVPPSVNVHFLQEMEIPRDLNALVDPQPQPSRSQPLPDIPQRLDVQNVGPAPKPTIPVQSHPAEPIFRDTLPFLPGIGPVVPAVPAAAEPSVTAVEILNQEAPNAEALLSNNGPGPGPQVADLVGLKGGDIQTDIQPVVDGRTGRCEPSFVEECHNEYEMVCEETSIEREKEVCDTVLEEVCETGVTTEYEPACFQRVINHCSNVSSSNVTSFIKF